MFSREMQRFFRDVLQFSGEHGIISLSGVYALSERPQGDSMEINSELKAILHDVCEKTGVCISLEPQGGEETSFTLESGGRRTEAYIRGTGEEAERTAKLVAYLVSSCDREPHTGKKEELRSVLLGEGSSWRAFRYMTKYNLEDGTCFAVELIVDRLAEQALAHIEGCINEGRDAVIAMDERRIAVVKFTEEEQTPYEFGTFLSQSLYEELGIKTSVGVGCEMKSFYEIALSYTQAATAVRMSTIFHGEGEVHSYREYLLVRMLEDVPKSRLKDYVEQFRIEGAEEIFEDDDMTQTAEAFLESSLNISETSRNLFMHRNTLTYRLDKIERATGLNIRMFSDAVTFRVITILYKLLQS